MWYKQRNIRFGQKQYTLYDYIVSLKKTEKTNMAPASLGGINTELIREDLINLALNGVNKFWGIEEEKLDPKTLKMKKIVIQCLKNIKLKDCLTNKRLEILELFEEHQKKYDYNPILINSIGCIINNQQGEIS